MGKVVNLQENQLFFQQDECLPIIMYFSLKVDKQMTFSARLLNLTSLDFFLWNHSKFKVFATSLESLQVL